MKYFPLFILILFMVSCSSDTTEIETVNKPDDEVVVDEEENSGESGNDEDGGNESEPEPEPEIQEEIPFNISIFAMKDETMFEFGVDKGELVTSANQLYFISEYGDFNVDGHRFIAYEKFGNTMGVWRYDVETGEKTSFSDYFDFGDDYSIAGTCPLPTWNYVTTFYAKDIDPKEDAFYHSEIYKIQTGEKFNLEFPESALPVMNCISSYKLAGNDLVLYYYDEPNTYHWGVIDLVQAKYLTSFDWSIYERFAIMDRSIVFLNTAIVNPTFYIYNLDSGSSGSTKEIFYNSDYLNSFGNNVSLDFTSDTAIDAQFENGKMLFYTGRRQVYTTGNIAEFSGPAILDLETGALDIFSSLQMFNAYQDIQEGKFNMEILQSQIDLESEVVIVTYRDAGYSTSPYGVLFFDFELNLLKQYDLADYRPLAIIKY